MPISSIGLIRDTILLFRDIISGTVVDPISDRQRQSGDPGSNARFVMTSWPQRATVFPFITVQDVSTLDISLGMQSEDSLARMQLQVDVWSKQVGQRDGIAGSVFYGLRTNQLGTSSLLGSDLFDFRLASMRNLDDPGKTGLHRKSMTFEVSFVNT